MKIALCIRPHYENGGDGVQVMKTKEYLEKEYDDVEAVILDTPSELNKTFDIVHVFNYLTQEISKSFFNKALELGIPIVSSPVYWDYSYSIMPFYMYFWCGKKRISERFAEINKHLARLIQYIPASIRKTAGTGVSRHYKKEVSFFIEQSQLILPNSIEEGLFCCKFADVIESSRKIRVVYNGVDVSNVTIIGESEFFEKYKIPRNYVLQVGRIEYLKNQLNLLASLWNRPDIPVVIVGGAREDRPYTHQLRKLARQRGNVFFISGVPHDDIYSFYRYARVHVLLSLRESPGLVNLEALSQGCPVVISDERFLPVKTYFRDNYISVNPFDLKQIEKAILTLYDSPRKFVDLSEFSWNHVAEMTYKAYQEVLNK